jgi:hypothetical protein
LMMNFAPFFLAAADGFCWCLYMESIRLTKGGLVDKKR